MTSRVELKQIVPVHALRRNLRKGNVGANGFKLTSDGSIGLPRATGQLQSECLAIVKNASERRCFLLFAFAKTRT